MNFGPRSKFIIQSHHSKSAVADDRLLIQLSAYADGELDEAARKALEVECAGNPRLAAELAAFRRLDTAAAQLPVPDVRTALSRMRARPLAPIDGEEPEDRAAQARLERLAGGDVPQIDENRFARAWQYIRERAIVPDPRALQLSARHDGEGARVPGAAGDEATLRAWAMLDAVAAQLRAPALSDLAAREAWHTIAQRTVNVPAAERRAWKHMDEAAAALPAPTPPEKALEQAWRNVTERIAETAAVRGGVPAVKTEQWERVWQGVAEKTAPRREALAAASSENTARNSGKAVAADFRPRQGHAWRWTAAAGLVAALLLSLWIPWPAPPQNERVVMEIPEVRDDRYQVQVKYIEGQANPVLCFFLKPDSDESSAGANRYWLPE